MSKLIGTNKFVKRQTADSRFTHYNHSWEMLEELVEANFNKRKPGYRDGVCLVPIKCNQNFFMKGPYTIDSTITAVFAPRAEGEEPVLQITDHSPKIHCKYVDIVLYRKDVLEEDGDRSTDSEWEIVSINGKLEDEDPPMTPTTMARNFLHKKGGTKGNYTAKQFAESIWYWKNRGQ